MVTERLSFGNNSAGNSRAVSYMVEFGMDVKRTRLLRLREVIESRFAGVAGRCADAVGVKRPQMSRWVTDNEEARQGIAEESARHIEAMLGLPRGWLDSSDEQSLATKEIDAEEAGFVPVRRVTFKLSAGVTGFAVEAEDGETPPIFFRRDWFERGGYKAEKLLAVRVSGDSMVPSLYDGDLVIVNTDDTRPRDGEAFAANYEGELVIKRVRLDGGACWLDSDNRDQIRYRPRLCGEGCFILGRVIYKQSERI